MKRLKVAFSPTGSIANKYLEIIIGGLNNRGCEVISIKELLFDIRNLFATKIVHLNWFEDAIGKTLLKRILNIQSKLIILLLLIMLGKRIVWTMHNKKSHRDFWMSRVLRLLIVFFSKRIIIHCEESRMFLPPRYRNSSKVVLIPHPNYIDVYGPKLDDNNSSSRPAVRLLFIGAIKPYKNIDILINAIKRVNSPVELMIAGNPSDETFTEKLFKEADSIPNIKLDARFIPDEELPLLIHNCDVVVIPLSLKSSLNSGSVILSFSYGRTVISPKVGTILEYPEDLVFSYLYRDEQEHVINLAKVIEKVSNIGFSDKEALLNMGEEMFHIVSKVNNKDIVVEAFLNTYKPML